MTKITISRTFDPAKVYTTESGKELKEFIESELSVDELVLRTLSNGVSFQDNMNCVIKDVDLKNETPQTIGVSKPVGLVLCGRNYSKDFPLAAPIHWYYDDQNNLTVMAKFSPIPTVAIKLSLVLLFS